jgi:hypothetical protein
MKTNIVKSLIVLIIVNFSVWNCCEGQSVVTLKSLLTEMTDFESVARWPQIPYTTKQASSYDRRSISPDKPGWFGNDDYSQYIRLEKVDGHKEQVMMDADGPGAIVRFWLTTFRRNGKLRIYFDGATKPEIIIPGYDLMQIGLSLGSALLEAHSSYEAKEKGGSTLYLPLPYAKHCKITWEDNDPDNQPRYYQVNYRTYNPGTKVRTFTIRQVKGAKGLTDFVNRKLLNPGSNETGKHVKLEGIIPLRKELAVKLPEGSSAVHFLSIKVKTEKPGDYDQALRSTILKIKFDGQQTVWCPISDFSGSGVGGKPLQSWYRTVTEDGKIVCRWTMPYNKSATISLLNLSGTSVKVSLVVITRKWEWDANSMYFHADWKDEANVLIKRTEKDHPTDWDFNRIEGKGVFLGDCFAIYNHMHKWYGEGDQKLYVDGMSFPVEFGTGTEDYYNTSWAPVVLYQTPFANAPRADNQDSFGYNTFTRTRNLDAVPFTKSFRYSLETLGWENGTADFAATTYWYGFKEFKSSVAAQQSQPVSLTH